MAQRDEVFMLTGFHEVGMEKGKLFQVTFSLENGVEWFLLGTQNRWSDFENPLNLLFIVYYEE